MRVVFFIMAVAIVLTAGIAVFVSRTDRADSPVVGETLVAASAERGKIVFRSCRACHVLTANTTLLGPSLGGVIDRPSGSMAGYRYSSAMAKKDVIWDEATLMKFLGNPRGFVPGTKMGFAGFKDQQKIVDLLAYLRQEGGVYTAATP